MDRLHNHQKLKCPYISGLMTTDSQLTLYKDVLEWIISSVTRLTLTRGTAAHYGWIFYSAVFLARLDYC